jgi:hypothetical protein
MGDNLKVVLVEFSTLRLAIFLTSVIAWHREACTKVRVENVVQV